MAVHQHDGGWMIAGVGTCDAASPRPLAHDPGAIVVVFFDMGKVVGGAYDANADAVQRICAAIR